MNRYIHKVMSVLLCLIMFCATASAQSVPYTVKLDSSVEIYKGHGEDYGFSGYVGEDGVYTIVEEEFDEYGNLWGRLKSGAGWVLLEAAEVAFYYNEVPYTISLKADDVICEKPNHGYLRDVGADGVYTIVEEAYDEAGNLWGRLKSGAGWVCVANGQIEFSAGSDYTVSLDAWVPIYNMPDEMNAACVGIVGEDGVYTIVDEVQDELGNVWGKLKSGAGWVNLNYVRFIGKPPITVYFADIINTIDPDYCDYIADGSEYMIRIAFRANENLSDIRFTTLAYGDVYEVQDIHCSIEWLEEDSYFVAGVVFYGDMTTYGISFVDEAGEERHYAVSLSGMNGALVLNEYVR